MFISHEDADRVVMAAVIAARQEMPFVSVLRAVRHAIPERLDDGSIVLRWEALTAC